MAKKKEYLFKKVIYMTIMYFLGPCPLFFLFFMRYTNNIVISVTLAFASVLTSSLIIYVTYSILCKYTNKKVIQKLEIKDIFYVIGGYAFFLLGNSVLTTLNHVVYRQSQSPNNQVFEKYLLDSNSLIIIFLIVNSVILSPIIEELIFRGVLMNLFFNSNQVLVKVLLSSVLFASGHGFNTVFEFLTYALMGTVLAFVYLKTGKLQNAIALHMLSNAIATLAVIFV